SGIRFSQNRKALQSEISRFVEEMYSGTSLLQTEAASLQASVIDSAEEFINDLYTPKLGGDW
ncbi:MAG: hypothetical protein KKI09_04810, partial [Spirochaetes bacterium]|nr:hypothetical protein [Spirochaetota bacterium]MBU0954732.1 hypothetical protein [Spirochaetota bacterium]